MSADELRVLQETDLSLSPSEDRCEQNGKGTTQFYNKEASSTEGRYHHTELMVLRWKDLHYRLGAEGLFWSWVIRHCWLVT